MNSHVIYDSITEFEITPNILLKIISLCTVLGPQRENRHKMRNYSTDKWMLRVIFAMDVKGKL